MGGEMDGEGEAIGTAFSLGGDDAAATMGASCVAGASAGAGASRDEEAFGGAGLMLLEAGEDGARGRWAMLRCAAIDEEGGPGDGRMAAIDADDMVFALYVRAQMRVGARDGIRSRKANLEMAVPARGFLLQARLDRLYAA